MVLPRLKRVKSDSIVEKSRDPKDNFLLALCRDGKADYLVSGDADLLVLSRFENTEIKTMANFMMAIQSS